MSLPPAGRRVLVTRAAHQAGKLSDGLRAVGVEPVEVPVLEIGEPQSFDELDTALRCLPEYNWIVFSSANAVRATAQRAAELNVALRAFAGKVAAVGPATATAVSAAGLHVHFVPEKYVAESLVEQFPEEVKGKRFLLARAAVARDVIPDALRGAGARVDVADAYQNVLPEDAPELLRRAVARPLDAATFTSSSTVTHLAEAAAKAGIAFPLNVPAVSIGPITSQTLREFGWEPTAEAEPSDVPGLVVAVMRLLSR